MTGSLPGRFHSYFLWLSCSMFGSICKSNILSDTVPHVHLTFPIHNAPAIWLVFITWPSRDIWQYIIKWIFISLSEELIPWRTEAVSYSEMLENLQQTIKYHLPEALIFGSTAVWQLSFHLNFLFLCFCPLGGLVFCSLWQLWSIQAVVICREVNGVQPSFHIYKLVIFACSQLRSLQYVVFKFVWKICLWYRRDT